MNPARHFGSKLFTFFAGWGEVAMTSGRATPYFRVPIVAPICGVMAGAWIYINMIGKQVELVEHATAGCEVKTA